MKLLISLTLLFSLSLSVDIWVPFVNEEGLEYELSSQAVEFPNNWSAEKGGNGGGAWSDDCKHFGGLGYIYMECGKYVGALRLTCKNKYRFDQRGLGLGNGNGKTHTIKASKITSVQINAGSYVDRVEFYEGSAKTFSCGSSDGGHHWRADAPSGMVLCAFKGRSGHWMDKLAAGFCWADRDCKVSNFECGQCTKQTGKQLCKRKMIVSPKANGKKCPPASETRNCKVDCEQSGFTCHTCDKHSGKKICTRQMTMEPKHGGKACGHEEEPRPCPVACEQGGWTCGGCDKNSGKKECERPTTMTPKNNGKACEASEKTENCPVACEQGEWSCGNCIKVTGTKSCQRPTMVKALNGGKACEASTRTDRCKVDCEQSEWSLGTCNKTNGKRPDSRTINVTARNGGKACEATSRSENCKVDCEQTDWSVGTCDKKTGKLPCKRETKVTAKNGGKACGDTSESRVCKVDCEQTGWSVGTCDKKTGKLPCKRTTTVTAKNGGKACGATSESRDCKVDCEQTGFTFGSCDKKTGKKKGTRKTTVTAKNKGTACGSLTTEENCAVNCEVGSFGGYSKCSKLCGTGKSTRTRKCTVPALNGGNKCPALSESKSCNTFACVRCPAGSSQFGPYNGDHSGQGMVKHKYNLSTTACFDLCRARSGCGSIHYFAKGGHPGIAKTVCELYPTSVTKITKTYGTNSIVCKVPKLTCPSGSVQVGAINADVGGRGEVGHIYNLSITQCRDKCNANKKCESYHWFPKNGHPGKAQTVCELYGLGKKPTGKYGNNSIVCRGKCCANFYQHCSYRGWNIRECGPNKWIGSHLNDNLSSVKVEPGCKVTLYQHSNYNGKKVSIKGNKSCLVNFSADGIRNWNDQVSSWKVGKGLAFRFSRLTEEEMAEAEEQFVDEEFENEEDVSQSSISNIAAFGAVALVGVGFYIYKQRQVTADYEELIDDV